MAGLATPVASSEAWPQMGAQAELALNGGWVFDQRPVGIGGFITNCSETSSGSRFISTGDATAFYMVGRPLQVFNTGTLTYCVVGQSSFAGGITTVYVGGFNVGAGTTALTTGTMISVGASPLHPGATLNGNRGSNTLSFNAAPSTGIANWIKLGTAVAGAHPAIAPAGEDTSIDISMVPKGSGTVKTAASFSVGVTFPSTGLIRLANSATAIVGKTSTGGDDIVWPHQFSSTTLAADVASSGVVGTNVFNKTLAVGTWWIHAGATIQNTIGAYNGSLYLADGASTLASAFFANTVADTTNNGRSVSVSQVVSPTTALAYQLVIASNSTASKALAITPGTLASTGATWWTAVKIG